MSDERPPSEDPHPDVEELVEEVRDENPDEITRREAFELELMREGRSEEGRLVESDDPHDNDG
jgi:hypothetical protein